MCFYLCCFLLTCVVACPDGWVQYDSNCYHAFNSSVTWDDAQAICSTKGAYLANIANSAENLFLGKFLDTIQYQKYVILCYACRHDDSYPSMRYTTIAHGMHVCGQDGKNECSIHAGHACEILSSITYCNASLESVLAALYTRLKYKAGLYAKAQVSLDARTQVPCPN